MSRCEHIFNPDRDPLNEDPKECPNRAVISVGTGKRNIHLCEPCSERREYQRLTVRKPLKGSRPGVYDLIAEHAEDALEHCLADDICEAVRVQLAKVDAANRAFVAACQDDAGVSEKTHLASKADHAACEFITWAKLFFTVPNA